MRFDIGKRVVARVERRGSLCDSTEHVGILQGSSSLFPLPDRQYLTRPSAEERTVRPAPLTNITDEADHTQKKKKRPVDNDRYVRYAPDNPKKVSFLVPYFVATRFLIHLVLPLPVDALPLRRYVDIPLA